MVDLDVLVRKPYQVIRLVQSVRTLVGADRTVNDIQRVGEESLQLVFRQVRLLPAYSFINARAISLTGQTNRVRKRPAVQSVRLTNSPKELQGLLADHDIRLNQLLQESDIAPHVTQRDHRRTDGRDQLPLRQARHAERRHLQIGLPRRTGRVHDLL